MPPQNVVPFPLAGDARTPGLSAIENHAFDEIARRLSARLDQGARGIANSGHDEPQHTDDETIEPVVAAPDAPAASAAPWLDEATATRGDSTHDKPLLDRVPVGLLIYRLDHPLYANAAFLERTLHIVARLTEAAASTRLCPADRTFGEQFVGAACRFRSQNQHTSAPCWRGSHHHLGRRAGDGADLSADAPLLPIPRLRRNLSPKSQGSSTADRATACQRRPRLHHRGDG